METKELYLIGNNASEGFENRRHKAGLTQPDIADTVLRYAFSFINGALFIYSD